MLNPKTGSGMEMRLCWHARRERRLCPWKQKCHLLGPTLRGCTADQELEVNTGGLAQPQLSYNVYFARSILSGRESENAATRGSFVSL